MPGPSELRIEPALVSEALEDFIARQVEEFRRYGAIVGLSGGLDSSVVATLAARALGPDRVLGLLMPELDSAPESKALAQALARRLGIGHKTVGLAKFLLLAGVYGQVPLWVLGLRRFKEAMVRRYYRDFAARLGEGETPFSAVMVGTAGLQGPWLDQAVAYHRVKVRLRMVFLYYYAELRNLLVLGTDNKTELAVGFFVKYGDAAADVAPLALLYKTQVRQLARFLGLPQEIIDRPPSPDILPGITDEYALGLDYETLDRILWRMERGMAPEVIAAQVGVKGEVVEYVEKLVRRSEHMRASPRTPESLPGLPSSPGQSSGV